MSAVAKRYARAAVDVANEQKGTAGVEQLAAGLTTFQQAFDASQDLKEVLLNPALSSTRQAALQKVLASLKVEGQAARLVDVLVQNDRIEILPDVVTEVVAIADEQVGRVRAQVTCATELSDAQVQRLVRALEKRFGQKVVVEVAQDAQLLGGLVVQVGDVTLDSSLRRQLTLLRERLLA